MAGEACKKTVRWGWEEHKGETVQVWGGTSQGSLKVCSLEGAGQLEGSGVGGVEGNFHA